MPDPHPSKVKKASTVRGDAELVQFARAFKSESELHQNLARLLRQMDKEGVRILHGPMEHGRDIVFYAPGGLGERSLFACVVKNESIKGELGRDSSARTVLQQAQDAFAHPYIDPDTGEHKRVKGIYIISPYECTPIAMQTISIELQGKGAVEFRCGVSLLELFAKYWRSFFVESNVLVSYLSALTTGLQRDTALLQIILQKSILADVPKDFRSMYVPQYFGQTVRRARISDNLRPSITIPSQNVRQYNIRKLDERLERLSKVVAYFKNTGDPAFRDFPDLGDLTSPMKALSSLVGKEWQRAYQAHIVQIRREHEASQRKGRERGSGSISGSSHQTFGQLPSISERSVSLNLVLDDKVDHQLRSVEEVHKTITAFLEQNCGQLSRLTAPPPGSHEIDLSSAEFQSYCRLFGLEEAIPGTISFEAELVAAVEVDATFLDSGNQDGVDFWTRRIRENFILQMAGSYEW